MRAARIVRPIAPPHAGDPIRGGAGCERCVKHRIYLICGYAKSTRENLTPRQLKVLAELMKDVKGG